MADVRRKVAVGSTCALAAAAIAATGLVLKSRRCRSTPVNDVSTLILREIGDVQPSLTSRGLDGNFLRQLRLILKIVMPSMTSKATLLLLLHSSTLLLRSLLSMAVARIEGSLVRSIVGQHLPQFTRNVLKWGLIAVPASFTNSLIRFLEAKLASHFRTKLVLTSYQLYFNNNTFYRVSHLDRSLQSPDQCMTDDIEKFSRRLASLYSSVSKPLLDIIMGIYSLHALSNYHGTSEFIVLPYVVGAVSILSTFLLLKGFQPRFGQIVSEESRRKGDLRFAHAQVIANSEEIAFYRGGALEHGTLARLYQRLMQQTGLYHWKRLGYVFMEQLLLKYGWSFVGMLIVAIPIISTSNDSHTTELRTEGYTVARNLLITIADAIERLMSSYKDLEELSGYTSRVGLMLRTFAALDSRQSVDRYSPMDSSIRLKDVTIQTPAGQKLASSISLDLQPDRHIVIMGPNGCGKSSLFRIIGGLWPVSEGVIHRGSDSSTFYVPQRPYLAMHQTLRTQVTYPDSVSRLTDDQLDDVMRQVGMEGLAAREGGWDSVQQWTDRLSGGEKQRIAIARVLYHAPRYALLDEATSAVSQDSELGLYERMQGAGVTLLTITHNPAALAPLHTHALQFDGKGNCTFGLIDDSFPIIQ